MKPTLVIMAAGMGSRYGGLKQIDTVDDAGDKIVDFSVYDAMKAGFGKVAATFPVPLKKRMLARFLTIYAMFGIGVAVDLLVDLLDRHIICFRDHFDGGIFVIPLNGYPEF